MADGWLLTLLFGLAGAIAIFYYSLLPSRDQLKHYLPNRVTPAGVLMGLVFIALIAFIWLGQTGFVRFRTGLGVLFDLLIVETVIMISLRWLRQPFFATLLGLLVGLGFWWWQAEWPSVFIFNLTFIIAPLGATALLIKMGYLRNIILGLIAVLWTIYDLLATMFLYPEIYLPAAKPTPSFLYPAIISGNLTLGSGDLVFLSLMALLLRREYGVKAAWTLIGVQAAALLIVIYLRTDNEPFPLLTVMTPLFLIVWWWFRRQHLQPQPPAV